MSSASMANTVLHSSRNEQAIKGFALFHNMLASKVLISDVAATEWGVNGFASFYAERQAAGVKASDSDTSSLHQLKNVQAGARHGYAFYHDVAPSTVSVATVQGSSAGVQGWFDLHETNRQNDSGDSSYLDFLQDTRKDPTMRKRTACMPTPPTVDNSLPPLVTSGRESTAMWDVTIVVASLALVVHVCFCPVSVSASTTTPPTASSPRLTSFASQFFCRSRKHNSSFWSRLQSLRSLLIRWR